LGIPFMSMGGRELALESAMNYRFLRKRGVTVRKTIDVMIGTFCIHHQLALLHDDRDFDPMVKFLGLEVIDTNP
jgi:predicted nucleic acid-binding protein